MPSRTLCLAHGVREQSGAELPVLTDKGVPIISYQDALLYLRLTEPVGEPPAAWSGLMAVDLTMPGGSWAIWTQTSSSDLRRPAFQYALFNMLDDG